MRQRDRSADPFSGGSVAILALALALALALVAPVGASAATPEAAGPADAGEVVTNAVPHGQQALVDEIARRLSGPADDRLDSSLDIARLVVDHRQSLTGDLLPGSFGSLLVQQQQNLDAAEHLLTIKEGPYQSDIHRAVALVARGAAWQAATMGVNRVEVVTLTGHEIPSEALRELAALHDVQPDSEAVEEMRRLDELPEPLRSPLTRFVNAFLALNAATQVVLADMDLEVLNDQTRLEQDDAVPAPTAHLKLSDRPFPGMASQGSRIDLTPLVPARNRFLDALLDLHEALEAHRVERATACSPLSVPPAFSIDLTLCDNSYTDDYALQLDVGGNDTYHNNAGGSGSTPPGVYCNPLDVRTRGVAALVDLGAGHDAYGDPVRPRWCGANGGGYAGVGHLVDAGGNDTYTARGSGTNGGGQHGAGFLLDAGGDDTYTAADWGANGGGGGHAGAGFLLDAGGDDTYTAAYGGTNGGGITNGVGFLLDAGGNDTYTATDLGTNGGGSGEGVGFLLDGGGDDRYISGISGTNGGGGQFRGVGFLLDADGDDTYKTTESTNPYLRPGGTNGGGFFGVGLLLDGGGHDTYDATREGANGGAAGGVGLLFDRSGNDVYNATHTGANGGGSEAVWAGLVPVPFGVGLLSDGAGSDHYKDDLIDCLDCTVIPKGNLGAQFDRSS